MRRVVVAISSPSLRRRVSQALAASGWEVFLWDGMSPLGDSARADAAVVDSVVLPTAAAHGTKASVPLIVLVSGSGDPFWRAPRPARVVGVVDRDDPDHGFVSAVREVLHGRGWLSPELVPYVLDGTAPRAPRQRSAEVLGAGGLTGRERDVALLVAEGLSNLEIAEELTVEISTVKFHVSNVLRKLGCRDRSQLVAVIHAGRHMAGRA
jgi:DNA-binding NarL/FixJ family response regulator